MADPEETSDTSDSTDTRETPTAELSEVASMDPADAETPIVDGDATAGYPASESGEAQEPDPEAGPNANPHRDQDTR